MKYALALLSVVLLAGCLEKNGVGIDTPYAFATAPGSQNGAGFLTITNDGRADTLVSAYADIAARTEIHDMAMEDGIMKMRKLDDLSIPAKKAVELAPQGKHIMFMGLHAPLVEGDTFDLTLTFEKAGEMTFPVQVVAPGQKSQPDDHDHDHDHDHDDHGHHHH